MSPDAKWHNVICLKRKGSKYPVFLNRMVKYPRLLFMKEKDILLLGYCKSTVVKQRCMKGILVNGQGQTHIVAAYSSGKPSRAHSRIGLGNH